MSCEELFLKQLRAHGFRMTPQREHVLAVLHQLGGAVTADEIFSKLQERTDAVDLSTLYRTLELLQEFGMLNVVDAGERQRLYIFNGPEMPHVHLVCKSCGKVSGVEMAVFQPLVEQLLSTEGFAVEMDTVSLPGLCRDCRTKNAES